MPVFISLARSPVCSSPAAPKMLYLQGGIREKEEERKPRRRESEREKTREQSTEDKETGR